MVILFIEATSPIYPSPKTFTKFYSNKWAITILNALPKTGWQGLVTPKERYLASIVVEIFKAVGSFVGIALSKINVI